MVGTSGSGGERLLLETASARSFPSLTSGTAGAIEPKEIGVCPATAEPRAGRGKAVLAGMGLDERDEVLDRLYWQRRVDGEHRGRGYRERDGVKILGRIVGHVRVKCGIDDEVGAGDEDGVAVRRRLRRAPDPDIAARAGDVLDVELRTQLLRELLRHEAGEHVGRTGGRVRNDDAHRSRGIGLCADDARSEHGGSGGEMQKSATGKGHPGPLLHCAAVAARSPSLYSIRRFSS